MDKYTLVITDKATGKIHTEEFYMDDFVSKDQFAEAVMEYALGVYEFAMEGNDGNDD